MKFLITLCGLLLLFDVMGVFCAPITSPRRLARFTNIADFASRANRAITVTSAGRTSSRRDKREARALVSTLIAGLGTALGGVF